MSKIPGDTFTPMAAPAEHSFTVRDEEPTQTRHESPKEKMAHTLAPQDQQSSMGLCVYLLIYNRSRDAVSRVLFSFPFSSFISSLNTNSICDFT